MRHRWHWHFHGPPHIPWHRPRRLYTRLYLHFLAMMLTVGFVMFSVMRFALRHDVHPRPFLTLVLVLVVMAVATAPLARRLSRPIERLTEANQRFGGGDLSYRIALPPGMCDYRASGDIDELMRLLRSWNQMAGRVQDLVRGHRDLLANVSHELRSPLSRIRLALALLPQNPEVLARLADVESDLSELERLIDDVLTTSQLEQSGLPPRMEWVTVRPMLTSLVDRAARTPVTASLEVNVADGPEIRLTADGTLLKRALWNLLENAAKYGKPPITLSAERRDDKIALHVTDWGAGIPEEERHRVLQPFYQVDRARTPGSGRGFGLGLTLALRIAEVHGGQLLLGPAQERDGQESGWRVTIEIPDGAEALG